MSSEPTPQIAVMGAGLVGCYLGGLLAHSGRDVVFIGREQMRWALRMKGLILTHYKRPTVQVESHQYRFETETHRMSDADIVLLCVKSQDTEQAALEIKPHLKYGAIVFSCQNGVRNLDSLRRILPGHEIIAGVVPFNVTSPAHATFHCGTEGDLVFERSDTPRFEGLMASFKKAGLGVTLVDDIQPVQWTKLLMNLNNGFNTLHGDTLKSGLIQPEYRKALSMALEEAMDILDHAGIEPTKLGKASPQRMIKVLKSPNMVFKPAMTKMLKIDDTARSSMLEDLEHGKKTEIDYLQGEIVRLAAATGQRAPVNAVVIDAVTAAFETGKSPYLSGKNLLDLVNAASKKR